MLRLAQGVGSLALQYALPRAAEALPAVAAAAARAVSGRGFSRYRTASGSMLDEPAMSAPKQGSTVVLVSGGIESAALLAYWKHWDHAQHLLPLFIDYGQKNVRQEEAAQQAMCRHLGLDFNAINASMVAHQLNMATAGRRYHDPLPHRNLLLLSLAASFAADSGAANIAICLNKDDLGVYSSASLPFLHHIESLYETLEPPIQLLMPLLALRKHQVITMGHQVAAPWHLTYSCAEGGAAPCGACEPCRGRAAAFAAAGVEDGLLSHHSAAQA